ncbi:hypothetical protein BJ165DRAFT_1580916 [Panaeolus papilionaceus]|nr:hypothetical protein BJ165DRAFT_1580916 [Panaeolus papilionaceus]
MGLLGHARSVVDFTIQSGSRPDDNDDNDDNDNDTVTDIGLNSNSVGQNPPRLRPVVFTLYNPPWKSVVLSSTHCDLSAVSTFRFHGFEATLIPSYLAKFNSLTLTTLEIYLMNYRNYDYGGALRNLRHLTITYHAKFRSGQLTSDSTIEFQWIIDILCSLLSPSRIESIRILTQSNNLGHLHTIDWPLFDSSVFGFELSGTEPTRKWSLLKKLDFVFFMQDQYDLVPLGTEFQDVWLPRTLANFRDNTDAVMSVRLEACRSILDYAPEGIR